MREIPKGSIYDRNGLPLATSRWEELEAHRADYARLGIDIDRACPRTESRHYPFGGLTFDLLGDLRTRARWGASNTSFVERDYATRLRGYDDRPTLVEVKNPQTGARGAHGALRLSRTGAAAAPSLRAATPGGAPRARPAARRAHVDRCAPGGARWRRSCSRKLREAGKDKGAIVVLDPATGDLLASVSYPLPQIRSEESESPHLDRARYGLYPPGSTFKVVTAMAALRKDPALAAQQVLMHPAAGRPGRQFHSRLESPDPRRCPRQRLRTARSIWSAASWSPAMRTSRSSARTMSARSRCSRRRACWASRWPRRISRSSSKSLPQIVLRTGASGGVAVPDGARGRDGGERRHDAGRAAG